MNQAMLTLRAVTEFAYIDIVKMFGFKALQRVVTRTQVTPTCPNGNALGAITDAVRTASVLRLRRVKCLQRSVVLTRLLRRHGVPASLVIGCHIPPLKAHAWVEVGDEVVIEDRDDLKYFRVLDRW